MAKRIQGITIELDGETKGLDKALQGVNKKSRDLQGELRDVERLLKFDPGNVEALTQKQRLLADQVDNTSNKLDQLRKAEKQVQDQFKSGDIGEEQYRAFQREIQFTEAELGKFKKALGSVDDGKALDNLKKDFQGVSKKVDEAKDAVKDMGSEIGGVIGGIVAGGGIAGAIEQALDTSSMNTKIDISMEVPPESVKSVKDAVNTVSSYGVDAESALEGVRRQWALNKDASDESNQAVVNGAGTIASAYSGIDFIELIQETNEISKALGISNEEALGLTDSLLKAGFPPEQLDIIAEYGTQLQSAGFEAGEVQALFAAGIETGTWNIDNLMDGLKEGRIRVAEFGDEVPKAMKDLLKGTDISAKQMQDWGKAVAAGGEGGSIAMEEIAKALNGVDDETQKNLIGVGIFGTIYEDQGQNIIDTLINAKDATVNLKTGQDELNASTEKLNADPAVQMKQAFSDLKVALEPLLLIIADVISKIAEWVSNNPQLAATIAAIVTVVGVLMGIFMVLAPIITAISTAAAALGIGLLPLIGIVAGVIAAIAALIAIGILVYKNWDTIKAKAIEIWGSMIQWFSDFWSKTEQVFSDAVSAIGEFISTGFQKSKETISNIFSAISQFFSSIWSSIKNTFNSVVSAVVNFVVTRFNNLKTNISNIFNTVKSTISNIWNNIKSFFSNTISNIVSTVRNKFSDIVNSVREKMNNVFSKVKEIWGNVKSFFNGINLYDIGANIIEGLVNGIKSMARSVINSVEGVVGDAIEGAKNLLGIKSPSRVFMEIGEFTGEGFEIGINSMLRDIQKASENMAEASIPTVPKFTSNEIAQYNRGSNSRQDESQKQPLINSSPIYLDGQEVARVLFNYIDDMRNQQLSNKMAMNGVKF